jgi:hypothetical protein
VRSSPGRQIGAAERTIGAPIRAQPGVGDIPIDAPERLCGRRLGGAWALEAADGPLTIRVTLVRESLPNGPWRSSTTEEAPL